MAISQRTADVVYSRTNSSILSTMNVSAPTTEIIAPSDFFLSFEAIFGVDNSNPASSENTNLFSANTILITVLQETFSITSKTPSEPELLSAFRGLLATPLLLFQPTWLNPNFNVSTDAFETALPPELYVDVDLSQSFKRLTIPKWTWIVYTVISLSIYVWCVAGMVVSLFVITPPTTAFEAIDFASRIVSNNEDNSFVKSLTELSIGSEDMTRRILQDKAVFVREVPLSSNTGQMEETEMEMEETVMGRKIGLASNDQDMRMLRRKVLYE